jgi:pyruvate kinase
MLSEETAMGNFPVQTVKYMTNIAQEAEKYYFEQESDMTRVKASPHRTSLHTQHVSWLKK